jgi:hypothetical protein
VDPLLAELAKRFDPAVNSSNLPGPYGEFTLFQLIVAWRELAWRNAERLVAATTQTDRNLIARSIRDHARAEAKTIRTATAYLPLLQSNTQRDAYCAANG